MKKGLSFSVLNERIIHSLLNFKKWGTFYNSKYGTTESLFLMDTFVKCANYVAESAGSQTLHPVSDLNSAEHFTLLSILKRKQSFWFWKDDKIIPTQLKLQDILLGNLNPNVLSSKSKVILEEVKETPTFSLHGGITAKIASQLDLDIQGDDKLTMTLDLGNIVKTSASWELLQEQLLQIPLNIDHPLLKEVKNQKRSNLAVVLESLSTQGDAKVNRNHDAVISTDDSLPIKKSVININFHGKGSIESKTVNSFIIPENTTLAFSCNVFSINQEGKIELHTAVDSLDEDADDTTIAKTEKLSSLNRIQEELYPLLKSSNFDKLKDQLILMISNMSIEEFKHMHLLLSLAELNIENQTHQSGISMAVIDPTLKIFQGPSKSFLEMLQFEVPADTTAADGKVDLPKEDENKILKLCMTLLDNAEDVSESARKFLKDIPIDQLKVILGIIENVTSGDDTLVKSDESSKALFMKDEPAKNFLNQVGFVEVAMDDVDMISFTGNDRNLLLDIYAILYVLVS